jgi:8-oxo-dGTP diphosphatase
VALAVPLRNGRILVARRPCDAHQGGVWEFPGGRIEPGEEPAHAAVRELLEETGLEAAGMEPLVTVLHDYPDRPVRIHAYLAREPAGDVRTDRDRQTRWLLPGELRDLEMPLANGPVVKALCMRLGTP